MLRSEKVRINKKCKQGVREGKISETAGLDISKLSKNILIMLHQTYKYEIFNAKMY